MRRSTSPGARCAISAPIVAIAACRAKLARTRASKPGSRAVCVTPLRNDSVDGDRAANLATARREAQPEPRTDPLPNRGRGCDERISIHPTDPMPEAGFKDHFSAHADAYARYRPDYPPALFAWLA